jgi:hypothetical protein
MQISNLHRKNAQKKSRLGMHKANLLLVKDNNEVEIDLAYSSRTLGEKQYELTNHLGNVLAVVTDKKLSNNEPDVSNTTDYYPFGMAMPGRTFSGDGYRYGFNTQEKTDEISTDHYTALFWEYDSRIGRRWNNDPKPNPSISTYAAFSNNPIFFTDVLGDTITGDKKYFDQVKSFVTNQISEFNAQIAETNTQIANKTAAGLNTSGLERNLAKLENSRSAYQEILDEYTALENSTQIYNIVNGGKLPDGAGGEARFNNETKAVDVVFDEKKLPLLNALPHELKHAYQFETKRLSLGGGGMHDLEDEVEAYKRAQMFGFYKGANITGAWVVNLDKKAYGHLPKTQITASTPDPDSPGSTYGDRVKSLLYRSGKTGKAILGVIKDWQIWFDQGKSGQEFTK